MKRNTQRQGGFTLVELLVVITIIGMLMALLLPAVNAAVEQARSLTCKNNMRNVATACINFESTNGRFPGYNERVYGTNDATGQEFIYGWTMAILPQMDHHDWYEEFRRQVHSEGDAVAFASELLVCPSNPPTTGLAGWSAFCINAGHWAEGSSDGKPSEGLESPADGIAHDAALENSDGVSLAVITTMDYISAFDGTSHTLLISENVNQTTGSKRYWWDHGKVGTTMVWHLAASPEVRLINNRGGKPSLQAVALSFDSARPSSFHTGGVNMAFCDQRVIFVRETIAYRVYQHLLTPNGRESHMPLENVEVPLTDAEYN